MSEIAYPPGYLKHREAVTAELSRMISSAASVSPSQEGVEYPLDEVSFAEKENEEEEEILKRYNRYDWSYAEEPAVVEEEAVPPQSRTRTRATRLVVEESPEVSGETSSEEEEVTMEEEVTEYYSEGEEEEDIVGYSQAAPRRLINISEDVDMSTLRDFSELDMSCRDVLPQHQQRKPAKTSNNDSALIPESPESIIRRAMKQKKDKKSPLPRRKGETKKKAIASIEKDTVVLVGRGEGQRRFVHSHLILQYASTEIAKHLQVTDHGDYCLFLPNKKPSDWQCLQPFLEPHAVQPAIVTAKNLPILLPWFQQLKLSVLLQECDQHLLENVVRPPPLDQQQQPPGNADGTTTTTADSSNDRLLQQDVTDTVLLCKIAVAAGLLQSATESFAAAAAWLEERPDLWILADVGTTTAMLVETSKLLLECLVHDDSGSVGGTLNQSSDDEEENEDDEAESPNLFEPAACAKLFLATISYLPMDCLDEVLWASNEQQIQQLLENPLFPYMVREGIQRKVNAKKKALKKVEEDDASTTHTHHRAKSVDSNTGSSTFLQGFDDIQAGWNSLWESLNGPVGDKSGMDDRGASRFGYQKPANREERTAWLELVWAKLCEPAIFDTGPDRPRGTDRVSKRADVSVLDTPPKRTRPKRRTFAC